MRSYYASALFVVCLLVGGTSPANGQDVELQRRINDAVDRGVEHIKGLQGKDGSWGYGGRDSQYTFGLTALMAWTLLESGLSREHAAVKKAAAYLRAEMADQRNAYNLSLAVILFEQLGYEKDMPIIDLAALRLMLLQSERGDFLYQRVSRLSPLVTRCVERLAADVSAIENVQRKLRKGKRPATEVPRELLLASRFMSFNKNYGNQSTTQFAMLALWVARRHGIPTDRTFLALERWMRTCQREDGGWQYANGTNRSTPAMTCAGLLSLAITHGASQNAKIDQLLKDRQVQAGMGYLKNCIGRPDRRYPVRKGGNNFYYFLFSLERMAVVYGLEKIGDHDWYLWGAKELLKRQNSDGSWRGAWRGADTCFALLFLKKANVAEDLTQGLIGPKPQRKKTPAGKQVPDDPFKLPKFIRKKPKESTRREASPHDGSSAIGGISDQKQLAMRRLSDASCSHEALVSLTQKGWHLRRCFIK